MIYPIGRLTLIQLVLLWIKRINGKNNLKINHSYIVAANHASFVDDLIVPSIVVLTKGRYIHMYVNMKFFKNFFLRKFLEWGRSIPVDVYKSKDAKKVNKNAFNLAIKCLKKGELVGIFPEGHRSMDGKLQKARVGIAKLALNAKVPIIPIGIIGSDKILPKGKRFLRFKRCVVNIGKPMFFDKYYGKENNKKALIKVTTMVMEEIARLSKQKYEF
jgi:1-acyl-sn-glycerol-3-phosphate acyltransferase